MPGQSPVVRTYTLDSTLETIDRAEALVMEAAIAAGVSEDEAGGLGMAVRECVGNAVVHGNNYSAKKKVHLEISASASELQIRVGDEGKGFSLEDVPDPLAEENILKQSGRGILLIRAFVDEFEIRKRSPEGTEALLVKKLPGA
jgi:serine/threonine-protein kinase RsbW